MSVSDDQRMLGADVLHIETIVWFDRFSIFRPLDRSVSVGDADELHGFVLCAFLFLERRDEGGLCD